MGIKGLFSFLKRWEQPVDIKETIKNKSVGLDIFWFIHRSKGDLKSFQTFITVFLQYATTVHAVFDGRETTPERREELEERRDKRSRTLALMEEIMEIPIMDSTDQRYVERYLEQLKRQIWKPSRVYIDQIKSWLIDQGVQIHEPKGEADQTLIDLERSQTIDLIVTNDSDLIALGSNAVLRIHRSPEKGTMYEKIRQRMGCTVQQWDDFMYLCRHMKESDIILAYSLIRVYRDHAVERWLQNEMTASSKDISGFYVGKISTFGRLDKVYTNSYTTTFARND